MLHTVRSATSTTGPCHFQYSLYTKPIVASNFIKNVSRYTAAPPNNPTGKLQDLLTNLQHEWHSVSRKFAVSLPDISWCSDTLLSAV